ncbi:MAG: lectin-like protein, partial [Bacteroidia bacterium]
MKYFFSIFLIVAFAVQAQAQSISTPVVTGSAFCAGTLISCTVNASGFQAGNKFQLELSDGNGNFNQPIVLGEATDTALTSISGTLPKSALAGIGYRVRLVATQPAQTSAANAQNLTIIAAPYLQLADTLRVCGTTATLDAGPGLAGYTWNTGATTQTITVSSNGDYSVTVNNGFCTNADTIHVNFNNSGIVNNDTTLCQGGEMTLNSFGVGEPVPTLSGFDGPYYYNGHTYFYSQGTTTWTDAHTLCTQMGGHLATISDVSENNFLFQYTNAIRSGWIGLTDELSEGNYLWVTGEPFSFSYWDRGQPDNSGNEDYIHLTNNAGRWNDLPNNVPSLSFWLEFDQILTKKQKANWSTGDTTQ